jgi:hypothetical protein
MEGDGSVPTADKAKLRERLRNLDTELNRQLAASYGVKKNNHAAYANWLKSHQPFHWFIEFHGIMQSGGFDVVIGNPPYLEIRQVAVLAWGSLVWDCRSLAIVGGFEANGPRLPIEFCRVSGGGNAPRRLTLVIDERVGCSCLTYSALSTFGDLEVARENLREREGMDHVNGVGFVDCVAVTESHRAVERHPAAVETIRLWARTNGYDAVIWTALANNFHEPAKANEPFSVEAAIRYLSAKNGTALEAALNYIRQAPQEVRTPVREAVNKRWPES